MATVQGPKGQIEIFEDFVGAEIPIAVTNAFGNIGRQACSRCNYRSNV